MSFVDFKDLVEKWECMTDVPKKKRAMLLTVELPLNDAHGGLQRAVRNKFKNEYLMVDNGVEKLIEFLSTILQTAISVSILREAERERQIYLNWIDGKRQLSDILMKDSVNPEPLRKVILNGNFQLFSKKSLPLLQL